MKISRRNPINWLINSTFGPDEMPETVGDWILSLIFSIVLFPIIIHVHIFNFVMWLIEGRPRIVETIQPNVMVAIGINILICLMGLIPGAFVFPGLESPNFNFWINWFLGPFLLAIIVFVIIALVELFKLVKRFTGPHLSKLFAFRNNKVKYT